MKTKHKKITLFSLLAIMVLVGLTLVLAYGTRLDDPISEFFKKLYPVSFVEGGYISVYEQEQGRAIGQTQEQLILIKNQQNLLKKLGIKYGKSNFEDELKFDIAGKNDEYQALITKSFKNNPDLFYEFVVKPQTYDALLRIKYNSDFTGNSKEYQLAQSILSELNGGKNFAELAKAHSDDLVSGQLGGDIGFVTAEQILPELKPALKEGSAPRLFITRLGYDIVSVGEKLTKDGEEFWHVHHILIQTSGFDSWLASQL